MCCSTVYVAWSVDDTLRCLFVLHCWLWRLHNQSLHMMHMLKHLVQECILQQRLFDQLLGCWLVAYFLKKLKSSSLVLFCRLLHNLNPTPTQAPNTTTPHTNQQQPHSNQQQPRYPTKGI